jgi:DNA-binding transcriptional LysR family regulator
MSSLLGITNFVRTVQAGSFAGAARDLGISAVAVSKNVAALERSLGVRLLNRSTRALSLTDEGRAFNERCMEPLRALEEATLSAQSSADAPSGCVRVTSLSPFGRGYVIPLLQKFSRLYPHIEIDLSLDDAVVDMVAGGFDVGIRAGKIDNPSIIAREICGLNFVICAAPAYLSHHGIPKREDELRQHNCLRLALGSTTPRAVNRAANAASNWRLGAARTALDPPADGTFIANDFNSLEQAALNGLGLFNAPLPLVLPHFRSGLLRPVLPQCASSGLSIYLYYRSRRNQPARVRVFVDFMLEALRSQPDLTGDAVKMCAPYWA